MRNNLRPKCRRRITISVFAALLFSAVNAQAQQEAAPAKPLAFDAVSIHPTKSSITAVNGGITIVRTTTRTTPDGYYAENTNLKFLISTAYGVKTDDIVGGPDWITSAHYDINAKVVSDTPNTPALTNPQRKEMLRTLVAERFGLVVHSETKDAPIYELVVNTGGDKGGPRLRKTTPGDTFAKDVKGLDGFPHPGFPTMVGRGHIMGQGLTIASLLDDLKRAVQRPVVDKTGLTGKYDVDLHWRPETSAGEDDASSSEPSIFTAVQEQLGLRLNSTKGPVTTLVIDHAEQPSEN